MVKCKHLTLLTFKGLNSLFAMSVGTCLLIYLLTCLLTDFLTSASDSLVINGAI